MITMTIQRRIKILPLPTADAHEIELTNQDSAGVINFTVLTSMYVNRERHRNQATFLTGDGVKYLRRDLQIQNHITF